MWDGENGKKIEKTVVLLLKRCRLAAKLEAIASVRQTMLRNNITSNY
jgi:hypothetical protein